MRPWPLLPGQQLWTRLRRRRNARRCQEASLYVGASNAERGRRVMEVLYRRPEKSRVQRRLGLDFEAATVQQESYDGSASCEHNRRVGLLPRHRRGKAAGGLIRTSLRAILRTSRKLRGVSVRIFRAEYRELCNRQTRAVRDYRDHGYL